MNDPPLANLTLSDIWGDYQPTQLIELPRLARLTGVGRVFAKLESERPLGNFKVLGGMVAGLRALAGATGAATLCELASIGAAGRTMPKLICASEGNHGLAVAAAAQRVGARASVYLPSGVGLMRAQRIEAHDGEVIWHRGTYDDAVLAAAAAAARGDGLLVPDTTTNLNDVVVRDVMDGYALMAQELLAQFHDREFPSHMFIQAGVGGLAAAMARGIQAMMNPPQSFVVVEPQSAACVAHALTMGRPVRLPGDLHTSADMLSCGLASAPAVDILRRHNARSVLVDEGQLGAAVTCLRDAGGPDTTTSGAAGLAGLLRVAARLELATEHQLDDRSTVLVVVTEGTDKSDAT